MYICRFLPYSDIVNFLKINQKNYCLSKDYTFWSYLSEHTYSNQIMTNNVKLTILDNFWNDIVIRHCRLINFHYVN